MNKRKITAILLLCIVFMSGCENQKQQELNDLLPKEEERLVIATSHKKEVWEPLVREFEERYDVWADVHEGGTIELLSKIEEGEIEADVFFGGGSESLYMFSDNFEPYRATDDRFISSKYMSKDHLWTPFSALPIVLTYNPRLVSFDELTSWQDLLSPKFKGKIAFASPETSGSAFTALMTLIEVSPYDDEKTIELFTENLDGKLCKSSKDVLESVYSGENFVGVSIEEDAWKRAKEGKDLKVVYPYDGTSCIPDGTALIKDAVHMENAKKFIDFTIEKNTQRYIIDNFYRRSVRIDLPVKKPLPTLDKVKIIDYDVEKMSQRSELILSSWAFLMGGE